MALNSLNLNLKTFPKIDLNIILNIMSLLGIDSSIKTNTMEIIKMDNRCINHESIDNLAL